MKERYYSLHNDDLRLTAVEALYQQSIFELYQLFGISNKT